MHAVFDQIGNAADIGAQYRRAARHSFQQNHGLSLDMGGQRQYASPAQPVGLFLCIDPSREVNVILYAELGGLRLQRYQIRSAAGKYQLRRGIRRVQ